MPQQRYEQVATQLRARIKSGIYPPGGKLPSRRELRDEFNASDTVIDKAMMILRVSGLTESLAGVGVFVKGPPEASTPGA